MWVDEGGLIFYLVYEFERLRLLPGLDRSISNNCSSSNRTNNARAGFAPDELLGSGTTQPRPCIISSNTFATDKGRPKPSLAFSRSRNRFNHRGGGYFSHDSRRFVPGYYRAFPPGQKSIAHRSASYYLSVPQSEVSGKRRGNLPFPREDAFGDVFCDVLLHMWLGRQASELGGRC